jgi:hypothetical protein
MNFPASERSPNGDRKYGLVGGGCRGSGLCLSLRTDGGRTRIRGPARCALVRTLRAGTRSRRGGHRTLGGGGRAHRQHHRPGTGRQAGDRPNGGGADARRRARLRRSSRDHQLRVRPQVGERRAFATHPLQDALGTAHAAHPPCRAGERQLVGTPPAILRLPDRTSGDGPRVRPAQIRACHELASRFRDDREAYTDAKTGFISAVVERARA